MPESNFDRRTKINLTESKVFAAGAEKSNKINYNGEGHL